jgi:hypothetical protein
MAGALRRGLGRLREFAATQEELTRRRQLLDRPWEEDLLHWHRESGPDGDGWSLHGSLPPPRDGRRRSTTPEGWCPGPVPRRREPGDDA